MTVVKSSGDGTSRETGAHEAAPTIPGRANAGIFSLNLVLCALPVWPLLLLGSALVCHRVCRSRRLRVRWIDRLSFLLPLALKVAALYQLDTVASAIPMTSTSPSHFIRTHMPLSLLVMAESTQIEHHVASRVRAVSRSRARPHDISHTMFQDIDPFSGGAYLTSTDGVKYSVGPDLHDDKLRVVYDPTNGTYSPGDVVKGE